MIHLRRHLFYYLFGIILFTLPQTVFAKLFTNSYVSFELPEGWECQLDGTEYVCASKSAKQAKEAIIILAAKEAGPTDSLELYKTHLNTPKSVQDKTGKLVPSKKINLKEIKLNSHPWIDSQYLGSEINSYYTRYLATVKDKLAILVTFSAHKDYYTKYSSDFINAVNSLRVLTVRDAPVTNPGTSPGNPNPNSGPMGTNPVVDIQPLPPPAETEGPGMTEKILALILLLGAVGYYIWKKKKG